MQGCNLIQSRSTFCFMNPFVPISCPQNSVISIMCWTRLGQCGLCCVQRPD